MFIRHHDKYSTLFVSLTRGTSRESGSDSNHENLLNTFKKKKKVLKEFGMGPNGAGRTASRRLATPGVQREMMGSYEFSLLTSRACEMLERNWDDDRNEVCNLNLEKNMEENLKISWIAGEQQPIRHWPCQVNWEWLQIQISFLSFLCPNLFFGKISMS